MDKTEQERKMEQDDELYALLEKAVSDERLCVSGELIQKALRRVQDGAEKKPSKRYFVTLRYACAAAAALLAVVAGGVFLNRGGFLGGTKQSELCPEQDNSGSPVRMLQENNVDGLVPQVGAEGEMIQNHGIPLTKDNDIADSQKPSAEAGWSVERFAVPEELTEALVAAGYTVSAEEAEYWEPAKETDAAEEGSIGKSDRKQEIISALYGAVPCVTEGEAGTEGFSPDIPLYAAVRIETGQGVLWILLGEKLYLVEE